MNTFKIGDKVKTSVAINNVAGATQQPQRLNGVVKYVACGLATIKGGKTCDKKTCPHLLQDYVWVSFQGTVYSYHHTELEYDASQPIAAAPVLPSAASMENQTTGDKEKDNYLEKAKAAIKDVIKPKPAEKPMQADFYRVYNGFTQIKYDRSGKPFLREMEAKAQPAINDDEIDWDAYNGRTKGPVRKQKAKTSQG